MKIWYLIFGILLSFLCMPIGLLNAQVTIGSDIKPIEGVLLDLKEKTPINPSTGNTTATKGLLLPRVNLSEPDLLYPMFEAGSAQDKYKHGTQELDKDSENPIHIGLTVYNLTDNCLFCPGVYTWSGLIWEQLMKACCPCLFSITSGGVLHQSVNLGYTLAVGAVTANYSDGGTYTTTYQWYTTNSSAQNTGGTAIVGATSSTYILPTTLTSVTDIYYFYCVATNTCNQKSMVSDVYSVEVTDPCAGIAVTNRIGASECGTGGTVILKATANTGAIIRWYDAPTGGNLLQTGTSETDTYTITNLSATTTYWVEAYHPTSHCISPRETVVATVNQLPTAPTGAIGATICQNNDATLSATAPAGCTLDWYDAPMNGNLVASGTNSYRTPNLSATKTYYAEARNTTTGCRSTSRLAVVATITPPPTITATPSGTTLNPNGMPNVTASATPSPGANIRWFDAATGGTQLNAGNTFAVPVVCDTKYVYAEAYNSCGVSSRTRYTIGGVKVELHGTVTIKKISSLLYQMNVTFNNNNVPPINWVPLGAGFIWQTPTISTYPNQYTSEIRCLGQAGIDYSWRLRGYVGGCGWEIVCQMESWDVFECEIRTDQRLALEMFYATKNGASITINF